MNCTIHKDILGRITKVETLDGGPSILYYVAARQPLFDTMEEAAEVMALQSLWEGKISTAPADRFVSGEPRVFYQTPNGFTESFKEALTSSAGTTIEFGFKDVNGSLLPIKSISTSLNNDSIQGILNNAIVNDQLQDIKTFDGLQYVYRGKGQSYMEQNVSVNQVLAELGEMPDSMYEKSTRGELRLPPKPIDLSGLENTNSSLKNKLIGVKLSSSSNSENLTTAKDMFSTEREIIKMKAVTDGTFLLAPNGRPTELTEELWLTTRTQAFKDWFGDFINDPQNASKVVDENGDPKVMYHGSNRLGFHTFSITDVRDGGHFFSDSQGVAGSYTQGMDTKDIPLVTTEKEAFELLEKIGGEISSEGYMYQNMYYYDSIEIAKASVESNGQTFVPERLQPSYEVATDEGVEIVPKDEFILYMNQLENKTPAIGEFFLNIRDASEIAGHGANWNNISGYASEDITLTLSYDEDSEQIFFTDHTGETNGYDSIEELQEMEDGSYESGQLDDLIQEFTNGRRYGSESAEYTYEGDPKTGEQAPPGMSTRDWVQEANMEDKDGVIFDQIVDNGGQGYGGEFPSTVAVVFESSNIKSIKNLGLFSPKDGDIRFSMSEGDFVAPRVIMDSVIEKLNQTGLSTNTQVLNSDQIEDELINDPQYQKGIGNKVRGYATPEGGVVLNSDTMTLDTPIHEFGHLWNNITKVNNPELYKMGLNLVKTQGKEYVDDVKNTQPHLKGEAILEEALAQAIGDSGAKIIDVKKKSKFSEWLNNLWNFIAEATGISQYSNEEIKNFNLDQFSTAIAIEILKGQTVEGALKSNPGDGTAVTAKKDLKVNKNFKMDTSKYPSGEVVDLPKMTLKEVIEKYKGKIYLTTSDATTVSMLNGELIQGGPGYVSIKKNVDEGVGFAALDVTGAKTAGSKIYAIGQGDPVAVLVMVQSISATLGNAYGGDFLYEAIKKAQSQLSAEEFQQFKSDFKSVFTKFYDVNVKDIARSGFVKETHKAIALKALDNIENITLEEFHDVYVKDTNFNFRRNLMENLVYKLGVNSKLELGGVKKVLRQVGSNYDLFKTEYVDPNFRDMALEDEGSVVAGFEVRTDFATNAEMTDYIVAAQSRGVEHKMFNGKMPSEGSFVLDGAYSVNDNFNDYSKGETFINPEFTTKANKAIGKWNPKYKGFTYDQLKTGPSIAFKKYLESKYPQYLSERPGNASRDVARGMGIRYVDGAAEQIYGDYAGNKFSMVPDKYGRLEIEGIRFEKSKYNSAEEVEDLIKNGTWGMLTGQNPQVVPKYGEKQNYQANIRAEKFLKDRGYTYSEIFGKYGDPELSFLVEGLTKEHAIEFAKEFFQDSVATNEGLIYRDGSYNERIKGTERFGGTYDNFFSTINIDGVPLSYQVDYSELLNKDVEIKGVITKMNLPPAGQLIDKVKDYAVESKGGQTRLVEPINYANSKHFPYMTEDGEGNFVFYHYSREKRDVIKPGSPGNTYTPSKEGGAWSFVGGTAHLYTRVIDKEAIVDGIYGHEIKIPKDKVYDFNADRQRFFTEAKRRFEAKRGVGTSFDYNSELAFVTQVAKEHGYEVVVSAWNNTARGNTMMELTPTDTNKKSSTFERDGIEFKNEYVSNERKYGGTANNLSEQMKEEIMKALIDNGNIDYSCEG